MVSSFGLALFIFSISIVSPLSNPKCGRLSNGCELKSYYCNEYKNIKKCHMYVCNRIDLNFQFDQTEKDHIRNCASNNPEVKAALNNVYFQLSKPSILDGTFDLLNNKLFLTSDNDHNLIEPDTFENEIYMHDRITFRYLKGLDVGAFKYRNNSIRMDFHYSNFDFYLNKSLIRTCDNLENLHQNEYIFNSFWPLCFICQNDIRFYNCEYKNKICPLNLGFNMAFNKRSHLKFFGIQNTFYKSNFPRFQPISNHSLFEFISIIALDFNNMQNIELNSVILNEFLFSNIIQLRLFGDIVSIEKGLFKLFKKLQFIELDILSTRKLMHHIGIDWIFDLNSDTNVDINVDFNSNASLEIYFDEARCVQLLIFSLYEQGVNNAFINYYDYMPDEDFCLYTKIPIKQLILIEFLNIDTNDEKYYSCTFLWILRNLRILFNFCKSQIGFTLEYINSCLNTIKFYECNFEERLLYYFTNIFK